MSTKKEFKKVKKFIKGQDEKLALAMAMQSFDCKSEDLETAHTETTFIFRLKEKGSNGSAPASTENNTPASDKLFTVEKDENYTLQGAKAEAMKHFQTFEGNIKVHAEDETHIVLSKVRG